MKEVVKDFLEKKTSRCRIFTAEGQDFVDVTLAVAEMKQEEQNLGIVIDASCWSPFMDLQQKSKEWLLRSLTNVQLI